jgi:hypothetical protein
MTNADLDGNFKSISDVVGTLSDDAVNLSNAVALKAPLANPTFTGTVTVAGLTGPVVGATGNATGLRAGGITGGIGGQVLYQSAANTTSALANGAAGQALISAGTTLAPVWTTLTPANAGTLALNVGAAGASGTSITVPTGTGFNANSTGSTSYSISIGPAVSGLATQMATATTGVVRKTGVDTFSIDNTPLNDGALSAAGVDAGLTNTTVAINFSGAYSANSATNRTINPVVGPSLINFATTMTGGATGILRKTSEDGLSLFTPTSFTNFGISSDSGYTWGGANVNTTQVADTETDTLTLVAGTGISAFASTSAGTDAIKFSHSNAVTASSVAEGGITRTLSFGDSFNIPSFSYDAQGHLTSKNSIALTLPTVVGIGSGGTGASSSSQAITNLLPTGTTPGYVLTTGGPGTFYWAASVGGGGGAQGTAITTSRVSYVATAAQTLFSGVGTYIIGAGQLRVYVNGVRQMPSDYVETSSSSFTLTVGATVGDVVLAEVDGNNSYTQLASATTFSPTGGIAATNVQTAISNLDSEKMAIAGGTFTGTVTMLAGTTTNAPFKLVSGTNLTTPQIGAIEFNGTNVFATVSGSVRKTLAFLESPTFTGTVSGITPAMIGGTTVGTAVLTAVDAAAARTAIGTTLGASLMGAADAAAAQQALGLRNRFSAVQTGTIAPVSGTLTALTSYTELYDPTNSFASGVFTVPATGVYELRASCDIQGGSAGNLVLAALFVYLNGSIAFSARPVNSNAAIGAGPTSATACILTAASLTAGNTLSLSAQVHVNSGSITVSKAYFSAVKID